MQIEHEPIGEPIKSWGNIPVFLGIQLVFRTNHNPQFTPDRTSPNLAGSIASSNPPHDHRLHYLLVSPRFVSARTGATL